MKKIFLILNLGIICNIAIAQFSYPKLMVDTFQDANYNFKITKKNKKIDKVQSSLKENRLHYKQAFKIYLDEINTFAYKITVKDSQFTFNETKPEIFSNIKLPDILSGKLQEPSLNLRSQTSKEKELKLQVIQLEKLKIGLELLKLNNNNQNDALRLTTKKSINSLNEKLFTALIFNEKETDTRNYKVETESNNAPKPFNVNLEDFRKRINVLNDINKYLDEAFNDTENKFAQVKINFENNIALLNKEPNTNKINTNNIKPYLNDEKAYFKQLLRDLYILKEGKMLLDTIANEELITKDKFTSLFTLTQNIVDSDKIGILEKKYLQLNKKNWQFNSAPFYPTGDITKIDLSIENTLDAKENKIPYTVSKVYKNKGKFKLDFSPMFFLNSSYGNKEFYGNAYTLQKVNNDSQKIEQSSAIEGSGYFTLGALGHIYIRSGTNLNQAISFGFSIKETFNPTFHLGTSTIIGLQNRVIISIGFSTRQIEVLNNNYTVNGTYANGNFIDNKIPTTTQFPVWGGYFSIGYNTSKWGINK